MSVSLTDLRQHLNLSSTTNDDELVDMLDAAVDLVENIVGPISDTPVTEIHRGVSSGVLVLRKMPVAELTAISARYGLTSTALTLEDFELDSETGIVRSLYGSGFYGDYSVTYTAGRESLPAAIRLAVLIVAAHLWETQRGTAPSPLAPAEDVFATPGLGFAIPNRARELLAPYVSPVIA